MKNLLQVFSFVLVSAPATTLAANERFPRHFVQPQSSAEACESTLAPASVSFRGLKLLALDDWFRGFFADRLAKVPDLPHAEDLKAGILRSALQARTVHELFSDFVYFQRYSHRCHDARDFSRLTDAFLWAFEELRRHGQNDPAREQKMLLLQHLAEETLVAQKERFPAALQRTGMHHVQIFVSLPDLRQGFGPESFARLNYLYGMPYATGTVLLAKGSSPSSSLLARIADGPGDYSEAKVTALEGDERRPYFISAEAEDKGSSTRPVYQEFLPGQKTHWSIYAYHGADTTAVRERARVATENFVEGLRGRAPGAMSLSLTPLSVPDGSPLPPEANPFARRSQETANAPTLQNLLQEVLGVPTARFEMLSEVDRNPDFERLGVAIDVSLLENDRIDAALIDSLFDLANHEPEKAQPIFALFKTLREAHWTPEQRKWMVVKHILPRELRRLPFEGEASPQQLFRRVFFLSYLDKVLGPAIRNAVKEANQESYRRHRRPLGVIEMRQQIRQILTQEFQRLQQLVDEFQALNHAA